MQPSTIKSIAGSLKKLNEQKPVKETFTTADFIYDKVSREMSAEASALGDMFGNSFQVKSEHTGKLVTFVYARSKTDADGDTLWWEFLPGCPAESPRVKRVIIFND